MELSITLNQVEEIRDKVQRALGEGWGLDDPLPLSRVLSIVGMNDAIWALRCTLPGQADLKRRIVASWLADVLERVEGQMTDPRSRAVIPLLREHALTPTSYERWRRAARAAAEAAALAAMAVRTEMEAAARAEVEGAEVAKWAAAAARAKARAAWAAGAAAGAARAARAKGAKAEARWTGEEAAGMRMAAEAAAVAVAETRAAEEEEETWQADRLRYRLAEMVA